MHLELPTLHPSLPFIGNVPIQKTEVLSAVLDGEKSGHKGYNGDHPEDDGVIILLLLLKDMGPVGEEEIAHGQTKGAKGRSDGGGRKVVEDRGIRCYAAVKRDVMTRNGYTYASEG